jgi:DNA (cytosine-5)-methyltransferase 1
VADDACDRLLSGAEQRIAYGRRTLSDAAKMWPTPTANNYECEPEVFLPRRDREKAKHRNGNGFGLTLGMAVKLWPTPTARDHKDGSYCPNVPINGLLGRAVWPTPTKSDGEGGPGSSGRDGGDNLRTAVGGSLNPTFVEWLMGFPKGWTEVE